MGRISFVLGLVTLMVGCASGNAKTNVVSPAHVATPIAARSANASESPAQAPSDAAAASEPEESSTRVALDDSQSLVAALPTTCADKKDCAPPREFAVAACRGHYPSMAIAMFEKHTPWQRLYVKAVTIEAVNAYGERSTSAPMVFGEEVLVLRGISQPKAGRVQISSSDIDVLRWDGTCATVARELFSTTRMPNVVQATIGWRFLEDSFQEALLNSKYVAMAYERHRSVCKGVRAAESNSQCQKATAKLTEAIGVAVRGGLPLPTPTKLPAWATREQLKTQGAVAMLGDQ